MKSLPFRWQLILFILLTCGVTLSLAFVGFYLYDVRQFNNEGESRLEKTQQLMLDNITPLLEQNSHAPDLQLNLMGVDGQIAAAAVYSTDGKLLARYVRGGLTEVIPPLPSVTLLLGVSPRGAHWIPIRSGNRPLGTLYLKTELSAADEDRLSNLLRGSAIVFLVSALLAVAMAYRFQGRITGPITELARVSGSVQRNRDYNVRVQTSASGEIGELIDSFNAMLETIQSNTSELERARVAAEDAHEKIIQAHDQLEEANRTLEARVDDRTRLLAKAVKDAEEASKAKSSFLAKMSHELRTPLNAIIGYSEIMKEDAEDDGDTRRAEDLDKVLNAARHLLGLINDVLDISKIEAGKMELFIETFDLTKLINEVIATASPLVSKKGNTLAIDCPADIGAMHADATKLRQMLLNLLSNASKFTEKGTVTLKAVRHIEEDADYMELSVIDTGIGMTPEQLTRLFQAFSQADASTTSKYGGTGLGLAISKQFAQMMQGDITVTSTPGVGSTFTIRMPAKVLTKQPKVVNNVTNKLTRSPFPSQNRPKILVIDDDKEIRTVIAELLSMSGYDVVEAASGQQGLDHAARMVPDLILLDIMMPGIDGWTVLSKLQGNPKLAEVPVIVLSAVGDVEMAMSLGAASVLLKPVDASRLTAEIAAQLSPLPKCYVLLVEDDADSRTLIGRMLEREGWQFRAAINGNAAIRVLRKSRPAMIVLDLKMPGMSGLELLDVMGKNPAWARIPVVIVTSMDITQEMRDVLAARTLGILRKGQFTREQLADHIRPALQSCALAEA
ncbi:response regulator [Opitutus sp. GAS368]|uniref:response regulator n=1 Tax=Opitutus sp. GAS368 TaxID=1882749 RepID=UPI00087C15D8|nr:response regulator [Opitutus sp. GAS368]SDS54212.1 Signal transduction histidine kinase [Opitutus sp. GAS368]